MKPIVFNYQEYEKLKEQLDSIVYCKECRYCEEQGGHANCDGYLYCKMHGTLVDEGRFCSWGERRKP